MPITPNRTVFTFNHKDQVDEFGIAIGDYQEVQRLFDLRAEQNLEDINNIKSALASTADGDSGADNVKITPIANATGLNVQEILEFLATNTSGISASKADKANVIEKDSTAPYTPTTIYHPTNKGYVDDQIAQAVIGSISLIKATEQEAIDGTNDVKYMTPLKVKQSLEHFVPIIQTNSSVVIMSDGQSLEDKFKKGWLDYKDVINLNATIAGVITWGLPLATDVTRTAIMICLATKDISNFDYATCLADSAVTKNTLGKDAVTNTYTGLVNNTQYWVKAFIEYTIGGKKYHSNGVTVTFTYVKPIVITEFYNAGNEFTAVTGGWKEGTKTNIATLTKNAGDMTITASDNSSISLMTTNAISMSSIKTLKFELEFAKTGSETSNRQYVAFGITERQDGIYDLNPHTVLISNKTRQVFSLDVSAISSIRFINFFLTNSEGVSASAKIYRVWGEN